MNLSLVFFGITAGDLLLAAGRYLVATSTALLALKHFVWFCRGRHRGVRYWRRVARAAVEMGAGAALATLYWTRIWGGGAQTLVTRPEAIIIVWAIALLFTTILLTRPEGSDGQ